MKKSVDICTNLSYGKLYQNGRIYLEFGIESYDRKIQDNGLVEKHVCIFNSLDEAETVANEILSFCKYKRLKKDSISK